MIETFLDPTPTLEIAREAFDRFLSEASATERIVILHDSDADGVSAGVMLQIALQRLDFTQVHRLSSDRERNPWTEGNRQRVSTLAPERLFVLDLGSRPEPVISGVSTCFIDHHRPEGVPPNGVLVSGYTWHPIPNTSLLIWELCREKVDLDDKLWVAAIGTISDLGEKAPFAFLEEARKRYTARYLKEATTLINASRRASHFDPEAAARALLTFSNPKEMFFSENENVRALKAAREEVKRELEEAKKAAPIFAGDVALIRLHSPCQIHPLIAQIWRTRLPKYMVIAANEGYLPGKVNFSARAAGDNNVLEFLRSFHEEGEDNSYGRGHDQASGGSLPVESWNRLLQKMGFPESVYAPSTK